LFPGLGSVIDSSRIGIIAGLPRQSMLTPAVDCALPGINVGRERSEHSGLFFRSQ
jgi:hypothetical protein